MNEVRPRVTADAARGAGLGSLGHLADGAGFQAEVGGLTLDVQRVARNAGGFGSQHRVGLGAAVARKQHIGFGHVHQAVGGGHDVDGAQVHLGLVVGAPVAHEVIDFLDDFVIFNFVGEVEAFWGVSFM